MNHHRRSYSSESFSFSWEKRAGIAKETNPSVPFSWESQSTLSKQEKSRSSLDSKAIGAPKEWQRMSWESKPWVVSKERARISWAAPPKVERARASCDGRPSSFKERSPRVAPERDSLGLLPPPPCRESSRASVCSRASPALPPSGAFAPPGMRGSPKRGAPKKAEDPFLAAYLECTKSTRVVKEGKRCGVGSGGLGLMSCKSSCGVRDDGVVRKSQLPSLPLPRQRSLDKEAEKGRRSSFF